jgi:hypothetical protein
LPGIRYIAGWKEQRTGVVGSVIEMKRLAMTGLQADEIQAIQQPAAMREISHTTEIKDLPVQEVFGWV